MKKRKYFFNVLLGGLIFLAVTFSSNVPLAQTPSGSFAYVVNYGSNDVSVISLSTNTVIATIAVGVAPFRVVFTPDGSKAYVTNIVDDTVSVIDTSTHTVIAPPIPVGDQPQTLDVSPDGTKVYVANYASQTISIIDTATDTVVDSFASPFPVGIAFSPDGSEVWISAGGQNRIWIYSYPDNTLVKTVGGIIGEGLRIEFLPDGSFAYVNNGCGCCGNLQKISTASYSVVWRHDFHGGGNGLAIAPDGSVVYAGTEGHCGGGGPQVKTIDPSLNSVTPWLSVPSGPMGIAITPDQSFLYVTAGAQDKVLVVDTSDQTVIEIPVGDNPSDVAIAPLVIDTTPPEITPTVSGDLGHNGWYISDVTVSWMVTDPESEVSSTAGCEPTDITADTDGTTLTCEATSDGGTASESVTIKRDATPPTASASASPGPNANGWNNTDVTVTFDGVDGLSGIDACDPDVVLSSEGAGGSASGVCTDLAGNVSDPATADGINIDKTAPSASVSVSPGPNANGWNNSDVTVSFSGTDGTSGIDVCDPDVVLSSEGDGQSASGRCTDLAGNDSDLATASDINIDKTAPLAGASASPDPNANGWNNTDVTVSFSGDDGTGSGIDSCSPLVVLSGEGEGQSASGTCTDLAGNDSPLATADGINIDKTAPTLSITTPQPYAVQPVGTALDFSASDALSGLEADAVATLTDEAGTWEMASGEQPGVGVYEVVVAATDQAGNTATSEPRLLVIYDPEGGFVTGGGWIYSDTGAYVPDPTLEGKANFGFVSKYKKGATEPTGQTEFQFQVADLNFHSSSYEWLVVTGSHYARFKGSGTINGMGDYKFMLWAGDGEPDTFRIRIWEEDQFGNEMDIYDNGSDQAIGGGSVVIHTGK